MNSNFTRHNYLIKFNLITSRRKFVNSELANSSPGVFTGPLAFEIEWGPHVTSTITSLVIDLLFGDGFRWLVGSVKYTPSQKIKR